VRRNGGFYVADLNRRERRELKNEFYKANARRQTAKAIAACSRGKRNRSDLAVRRPKDSLTATARDLAIKTMLCELPGAPSQITLAVLRPCNAASFHRKVRIIYAKNNADSKNVKSTAERNDAAHRNWSSLR